MDYKILDIAIYFNHHIRHLYLIIKEKLFLSNNRTLSYFLELPLHNKQATQIIALANHNNINPLSPLCRHQKKLIQSPLFRNPFLSRLNKLTRNVLRTWIFFLIILQKNLRLQKQSLLSSISCDQYLLFLSYTYFKLKSTFSIYVCLKINY